MNIIKTEIEGIVIIEPQVFGDQRGYFFESWNEERYRKAGISCAFIQDNQSMSTFGVIRGLHYQAAPYTQAKLVRVISGRALDVAVDIRKNSPTYGQHVAVELTGENKRQLFIPRGFAHGFSVLSDHMVFAYKCDNSYMPSSERGIRFDDPTLAIDWHLKTDHVILAPKDRLHPSFQDIEPWEE